MALIAPVIAATGFVFALLFYFMSTAAPEVQPPYTLQSGDAAIPCQNVVISEKDGDTYYTCPHPPNYTPDSPVAFNLPAPTYKKVLCAGHYGCSHRYGYQEIVPGNLLSEDQKRQVIDIAMNLPETRQNAGWKLDYFIVQPYDGDKWNANVQLFLAGLKQSPPSQGCGWYGSVDVDLETLKIRNISNLPPISTEKC
ncbi:hypothetical protein NTE_02589 [Candidatus Nitrososphaera evergladensis SR1]|uniref:Uncharacterized protein n=2 Tax=Nitrososphaera TaxID=497726 RepID=A0A075MVE1_9ARCH|nr:hypothetical protein NTE_02589 [Candidatus Nitrososphaera evergladensis SR1]